jgi:hypothetical protein
MWRWHASWEQHWAENIGAVAEEHPDALLQQALSEDLP